MSALSKFTILAALTLAASAVHAETYVAQVFPLPPDFAWTVATGAGDNGVAAGYGSKVGQDWPLRSRAVYFTANGYKDITPHEFIGALINDSWGATYYTGGATKNNAYPGNAFLWRGADPINLHPAGYERSEALGGNGNQEVGYVKGSFFCGDCGKTLTQHACSWNGTAASFHRLHSKLHTMCRATGTNGEQQVGDGISDSQHTSHALYWTPASPWPTDLHPGSSFTSSTATANWGNEQAGSVVREERTHAAIWHGSPLSFIDLNPGNVYVQSRANGVRAEVQVGSANPISVPTRYQAILWHNTASNYKNLHERLPVEFWTWNSSAEDIDNHGNVVGYIQKENLKRAVIWRRVD
jgi:hypothetical protein